MVLSRFYFAKKEMLNFTKKTDKRGTLSFCESVSKCKYALTRHHLTRPLLKRLGSAGVGCGIGYRVIIPLNYREMDV